MTEATNVPANAALPMFYKNPVPLEPNRHAKAGLREEINFSYAATTNAIPVTVSELMLAARTYPVVFAGNAPAVPFAVVGLRDNENLFVDAAGKWRQDSYIPAYVRRYPFIFSTVPDSQRLVLCVDEGADNFDTASSLPFFNNGQPNEALQRVLKFAEAFQGQYEDTRRFGEWLEQNGMLEDKVAHADLGEGKKFTLSGFRLLNPEKLRALTDAQVLELHKRGWLPVMYFHLQSLQNLPLLSALVRERTA